MREKCIPTTQKHEVMEAVWMQVNGACEKLKEETYETEVHFAKRPQETADLYYSKLMTQNWKPKENQLPVIARTIEFIADELAELQAALGCPNSFIDEIAHRVASPYKTNKNIIRRDEE